MERPTKNSGSTISGKKKKHTIKSQVIVNRQTRVVIFTRHTSGMTHDFCRIQRGG
ncbi:MAG: hypothetical protein H0T45_02725 [Pyrinomonadaceae bacterium]|nr:hypothetical protein [Pyrinomonadaceae bacterium]